MMTLWLLLFWMTFFIQGFLVWKSLNAASKLFKTTLIISFYLLSWSLSFHILAAVSKLSSHGILLATQSLIWGTLFYLVKPIPIISPQLQLFTEIQNRWEKLFLYSGYALILLAFLFPMFYRPGVQDTLGMKIPRAWIYFQQGHFLIPKNFDELRLFVFPFLGSLLQALPMYFGNSKVFVIGMNYFSGLLIGLLLIDWLMRLNFSLRASRVASLLTVLSLTFLLQMTTDNDDLFSSLPNFLTIYFLTLWIQNQKSYLLFLTFGMLGIGMAAKPFLALYWPLVGMLCIREFPFIKTQIKTVWNQKKTLAISLFVLLSLFLAYPIRNGIALGEWTLEPVMLKAFKNQPFSWVVALHNSMAYFLQMLFAPIVDLLSFSNGTSREATLKIANSWAEKILPNLDPSLRVYNEPSHLARKDIYDHTVWFGFIPWVLFPVFFYYKKSPKLIKYFFLAFVLWTLNVAIRQKWIDSIGRYWILPVTISLPVLLAYVFEKTKRGYIFISLLCATQIYFAWQGLYKNTRFNLQKLFAGKAYQGELIRPELKQLLNRENTLNVIPLIYNFPIAELMWENPLITISSKFAEIQYPKTLNLIPVQWNSINGSDVQDTIIPLPFPALGKPGEFYDWNDGPNGRMFVNQKLEIPLSMHRFEFLRFTKVTNEDPLKISFQLTWIPTPTLAHIPEVRCKDSANDFRVVSKESPILLIFKRFDFKARLQCRWNNGQIDWPVFEPLEITEIQKALLPR